jgi:hypothetical protein
VWICRQRCHAEVKNYRYGLVLAELIINIRTDSVSQDEIQNIEATVKPLWPPFATVSLMSFVFFVGFVCYGAHCAFKGYEVYF